MQRLPLLSTFLVLLLGSWMLSSSASPSVLDEGTGPALARTVILVRHGEKADDDPRDPSLSEAGVLRAQELARVLAASGVTHLFSTAYKRTRQTLAPLAHARELEIAEYNPRDLPALTRSLGDLAPGSVAVIAGHSNTTPGLYKLLSGKDAMGVEQHPQHGALLPETVYDRLFVVTLVEGDGKLEPVAGIEMGYGAK